jgi:fluoride ion exporter CrcB/FEX
MRVGRSFFMLDYILAAVGSIIAGMPRFWISGVIANRPGPSFPEI